MQTTSPIDTHTFNRAVDTTIKKCLGISNHRAGEYSDSWALQNLQTPWLSNLLQAHPRPPVEMETAWKRLIIMASMLDIKLSRLAGPWKEDTAIDSINYIAAYNSLRNEFEDQAVGMRKKYEPQTAMQNALPEAYRRFSPQAERGMDCATEQPKSLR